MRLAAVGVEKTGILKGLRLAEAHHITEKGPRADKCDKSGFP